MDARWQSVWRKTKPLKHLTYCYLRDRFHATAISPLPNSGSHLQAQNTSISCPCLIPIFLSFLDWLRSRSDFLLHIDIFLTQIIFLISNSVKYTTKEAAKRKYMIIAKRIVTNGIHTTTNNKRHIGIYNVLI